MKQKDTKAAPPSKAEATLDDLVDQVGNLTNATTDLLNTTNISKTSLDEAVTDAETAASTATSAASESADSQVIASNAQLAAEEARDDAVAIVYEGGASQTPAPGKIPIGRGDGTIDGEWLSGADNTLYHAPMLTNPLIREGTGQPVEIDVSDAQDGSVIVAIPYLYVMQITGTGEFTYQGFKFGGGTILSPAPVFLGNVDRTTSMVLANQGEPVANCEWTPNYNGVNSYVEIPEWEPAGALTVSFDLYWPAGVDAVNKYLLDGTASGDRYTLYVDRSRKLFWNWKDTGMIIKDGLNHIQVARSTPMSKPTHISRIGSNTSGGNTFKGQISNLRLTDLENPENSRFYPGTIYSYVDPDATEVEMPQSTVLIDELGDGSTNGILNNFGTDQPYVPLLGEREEYCGNSSLSGKQSRGVWVRVDQNDLLYSRDGGSFIGTNIPDSSLVVAGRVTRPTLPTGGKDYVYFDGSDAPEQIQHAFQYPNTFKVIKPTDPDYFDYKYPVDPTKHKWTLGYNGVNSYVSIPEWDVTRGEVTVDLYIADYSGTYQRPLLDSRTGWDFGGVILNKQEAHMWNLFNKSSYRRSRKRGW